MNRTKTKIPLYIFIGLLVIALLYYTLVYTPLSKKLDDVSSRKAAISLKISEYDRLIASKDEMLSKIKELEAQRDSFPERNSPVRGYNLAQEILAAADASGVNISSLNIDAPVVYSRGSDMSIFSVRAIFSAVSVSSESYLAMLDYFEKSDRGFFYVNMSDISDTEALFSVTTELVLYYPDKTPAAAPAPVVQTTAP